MRVQPSAFSFQLSAISFARRLVLRCAALAGLAAIVFTAGCRQDMQNQPRMFPQRGSSMFPDHRGARPQVAGTVARGEFHEDSYFYTGVMVDAQGHREESNLMPFPVTMTVLKRGQEEYNVYCSACHSRVGNGVGMIVERGYKPAANFHDAVRMAEPVSHYFYVMTHGYGAMPDYRAQLPPEDRWAVAAYIRALQLSQAATVKDVPAGTQIQPLKEIAAEEHLPASFSEPWALPTTAVNALPPVGSEGTPGMAPAHAAPPKISIPTKKPASGPTQQ